MDLADQLAQHAFCADMAPQVRERLAACAREERFEAGAFLLRQNAPAMTFYLILEGQVEIKIAGTAVGHAPLETLGKDDAVGWSWFLPPHRWHFDAVARAPTRVLAFDAGCLRQAMQDDSAVGYAITRRLLEVVVQRLQAARMQLSDLYGQP
ncbi:MAG TPA: cyclic nucleotide-binding domain-containing protein [Candidatus Acidoferrales bacterium]|nr:cyclic nucleotide-binding domain-containing protein [Candidatus Acidoferrales bacterium]